MLIGLEILIEGDLQVVVFKLFGGAISWMSRRHVVVALSTTKAEYIPMEKICFYI